jgi:hypothetical protein
MILLINKEINQFITSSDGLSPYNLTISHLGSMLVRVASHAHRIYMLLKDFSSQRLSKVICQIVYCAYLGNSYINSLHNLSN